MVDEVAERGIKNLDDEEKTYHVRPWVRFWARNIDLLIWSTLICLICSLISIDTYKWLYSLARGTVLNLLSFLPWLFIEALLISKLGYTPGKWILNTYVRSENGNKLSYSEALKRTIGVYIYGKGLDLPLLSIITNALSCNRLMNTKKTKWDEDGNFEVVHNKIGVIKITFASIITIGFFVIRFCAYRFYFI